MIVPDEPTRTSCAISWSGADGEPPRIVAKGQGEYSDAMLEIAAEEHIPTVRAPSIVEALFEVELDEPLPAELHEAARVLIRWVDELVDRSDAARMPLWRREG